ncbi:hypothetical protein [Pannonibacter tanglangensis]|uniref:Transposase n=1 Tax=Pannonibacter tanglangensis TaxID=2750084 RepID=A0ABW9ZP31_9HYPH|nr:hypothetical protein [Pannonibacter sp. XCT-34]NBN64802.1 hypothetical protein [Pannonibacter sp. XCT-34]
MKQLRRKYLLTCREIAAKLDLARSNGVGWLTRMGLGRLKALTREQLVRCCQWVNARDRFHLDLKKLARFEGVSHRITGNCRDARSCVGHHFLQVVIDGATRLAYVEVLPDELHRSTTGFAARAQMVPCVLRQGSQSDDRQRLGLSRSPRPPGADLLGLRDTRTRPSTHWTKGHAERFHLAMLREQAMPSLSHRWIAARRTCSDGSPGTTSFAMMVVAQPAAWSGSRRTHLIRNQN